MGISVDKTPIERLCRDRGLLGGAGLRKPKLAQGGGVPEQELCPSKVSGQSENSLSLVPSCTQSLARNSWGHRRLWDSIRYIQRCSGWRLSLN